MVVSGATPRKGKASASDPPISTSADGSWNPCIAPRHRPSVGSRIRDTVPTRSHWWLPVARWAARRHTAPPTLARMADHDLDVLGQRLAQPVTTLRTVPLVIVGSIGLAFVAGHRGRARRGPTAAVQFDARSRRRVASLCTPPRRPEPTRRARAISAARGLTEDELLAKQTEGEKNPLTPGDFHEGIGPLAVAGAVVRDLSDGNFREAWALFDPNLKRCRVMAWLYNNRAAWTSGRVA